MKISARFRVLSLAVAMVALSLPVAAAPTPEDQAVLAPIQALFDGMAKRDAAAIKGVSLPGGTLIAMREGKPMQVTIEAWADRLGKPSPTTIQESIRTPLVKIDNDLAVVWAPFEVRIDGKLDSCGTDLFNLVRVDGKWLIANVSYTGRKDCAAK